MTKRAARQLHRVQRDMSRKNSQKARRRLELARLVFASAHPGYMFVVPWALENGLLVLHSDKTRTLLVVKDGFDLESIRQAYNAYWRLEPIWTLERLRAFAQYALNNTSGKVGSP